MEYNDARSRYDRENHGSGLDTDDYPYVHVQVPDGAGSPYPSDTIPLQASPPATGTSSMPQMRQPRTAVPASSPYAEVHRAQPQAPTRRKKKHPFLKFLGVVALVAAIAFAALTVMNLVKTDEQRMAEYTGTWQVKAGGNAGHPVTSVLGSLFVSNAGDVSKNVTIGIVGDQAQLNTFGVYKNYAFSFDKDHAKMAPADGNFPMEGDLVLGFLVITDGNGSAVVYEKVSDSYSLKTQEDSVLDADALLKSANEISETLGGYGKDLLQTIRPEDLQRTLDNVNVDPQQLQQLLSNLNPETVAQWVETLDNPINSEEIDPNSPEVQKAMDLLFNEGQQANPQFSNPLENQPRQ